MGGFGTGTYEATEQLAGYIATFPAAGLSTMKVYPLVSMEVVEKFVDTAMKNLKKRNRLSTAGSFIYQTRLATL